MIQWIKGAKIQDSEMLLEGYKMENNSIVSVLNAGNIIKVIKDFVSFYNKHNFFLFLEVPCNAQEEAQLNSDDNNFHKNIYYLDNISATDVLKYLELFEKILVNDGMTAFGIGNHEAEIGKYSYNMVYAFSGSTDKLKEIFDNNGITERNDLLIPWDIISFDNPGERRIFKDDKRKTIYDIVEILKEDGLYLAEVREENH